ncbi:MAG: nitric oxide synthase [Anaerolineaceae bacterium]
MKSLIVYDSFFGNTEKVAQAIGSVLNATVRRVTNVVPEDLENLDFLIVGSPTRSFRPSPAITEWLDALPAGSLRGVKVSAFDTRIPASTIKSPVFRYIVGHAGYADALIIRTLVKKGGILSVPSEGFLVEGTEGPLAEGELERASAWAQKFL